MNTIVVLLILILVALLFCAVLLYRIERALPEVAKRLLGDRSARDAPPSGQTINVNLGGAPLPSGSPGAPLGSAVPGALSGDQPGAAAVPSDETPHASDLVAASTSQAVDAKPAGRAAPSGAFSVTCPRCKHENSSYRTECFNCGAQL